MIGAPALSLMVGHTTHARYVPFERRFKYSLLLIDLDIDRLDIASKASALFGVDAPGLFSFRSRDHGAKATGPLRPWADQMFADAGIDLGGGPIRLLSFPRHTFYKFAPISVWRGFGPDGTPRGVIYEVHNTFGERHCYVAPLGEDTRAFDRHDAPKDFHVSPFFGVDGRYGFTLRTGDPNRFSLVVETRVDGARTHTATMHGFARPASTANFARAAIQQPLSTLGVTAAIHWEALWIWRRGARYHSKPKPPSALATVAEPHKPPLVYEKS
ncbi:MAG: DUF1365 domain-containing protein [Pseudomonadota bacterium]